MVDVRQGFTRKPDDAVATVIDVPSGIVPKFDKISDLSQWLADYFATQQFETITSTNAKVRFTNTGLSASAKRSREPMHNDAYSRLNSIVRNAEYERFEPKDKRHENIGGQDVYLAAMRLEDNLYAVVLKFDVPSENELESRKRYPNASDEDIRYKDHRLTEIEIAPVAENYGLLGHTAARAIHEVN